MSEKEGWKLFRRAKDMCNQSRESEAEVLFRQALAIYEKALGKNHAKTISVKITLGRFFEQMKRWSEAEEQYQELVDERERTLGVNHTDTLESKCQLGHTFYYQEKYSEAEIQYYQVVDRGEKFFSKNHKVMVDARYALAGALYWQKNYEEAIVQFQQVADGFEEVYGRNHERTLDSKYWLGCALDEHKEYNRAIVQLQQVVDGREEAYGENHKRTLNSKQWLRHALNKQKTSNEGVVRLQQAADSQRKALGGDHADSLSALNSSHQLKAELNRTLSAPSQNATSPNPTNRLDGFFPRDQYTDSDVSEISSLLGHINPQWSKVPRTYIVLRAIGQMPLLQSIIDVGFSDFWFPVTEQSLPGFMSLSARSAFVDAQTIVLTKSINLEKAENGHHCHFKDGESLPFESRGIIGHGGSSQVDKVLSTITFREYARKIVHRSEAFRGKRKEDVRRFIAEIQVLKRLKHYHVVEYVGSYTDAKFIGLIMSPVAEMDLSAYLAHCDVSKHIELRTFFGCLATALEFLHHKKVRHKDIKP